MFLIILFFLLIPNFYEEMFSDFFFCVTFSNKLLKKETHLVLKYLQAWLMQPEDKPIYATTFNFPTFQQCSLNIVGVAYHMPTVSPAEV